MSDYEEQASLVQPSYEGPTKTRLLIGGAVTTFSLAALYQPSLDDVKQELEDFYMSDPVQNTVDLYQEEVDSLYEGGEDAVRLPLHDDMFDGIESIVKNTN